jgi:hypothetical protein
VVPIPVPSSILSFAETSLNFVYRWFANGVETVAAIATPRLKGLAQSLRRNVI